MKRVATSRTVLTFGSIVALSIVVRLIATRVSEREHEARGRLLFASFTQCLLGQPLAVGELPSRRLRNVVLAQVGDPGPRRFGDAWPSHCASSALAVRDFVPQDTGLRDAMTSMAHDLTEPGSVFLARMGKIDDLWALAVDAKLVDLAPGDGASSTIDVPLTPRTLPFLTANSRKILSIETDTFHGPATNLVMHSLSFTRICRFGGADAWCRLLRPPMSRGRMFTRVSGSVSSHAKTLVASTAGGGGEWWDAETGVPVVEGRLAGAYLRDDGHLLAVRGGLGWPVVIRRDGGQKLESQLPAEERPSALTVGGDRIAWLEDMPLTTLRVLDVPALPAVLGVPRDLGVVEAGGLLGCTSETTSAIIVVSLGKTTLAIERAGAWSPLVDVPVRVPHVRCEKDGVVVFSGLTSSAMFAESRCTAAGCTTVSGSTDALRTASTGYDSPNPAGDLDAISIGGKLLVAWYDGMFSGVRFRFAEAGNIATAPDVVAYDPIDEMVLRVQLFPLGDGALLTVRTSGGLRAIAIDAQGNRRPFVAKDL